MFQLAFPQPEMLMPDDLATMTKAAELGLSKARLQHLAEGIRAKMNPHPANQKTENVPRAEEGELAGMQHKYRETVLFFPSEVSYQKITANRISLISFRANIAMRSALTAFDGLNLLPSGPHRPSSPVMGYSFKNIFFTLRR
jgi:hypothetical protein